MKKIIVLFLLAVPALGQKKEVRIETNGKGTIRVEKEVDGKKEVIERHFNLDSLPSHAKFFADSTANLILRFGEGKEWADEVARSVRRAAVMPLESFRTPFTFSDEGLGRSFSFSEGFSNVNVFTNKPESHILNVRFKSAKEEEVHITVVDAQGKVIKKDRVKEFKGEYMGQLALPKGTKGVHFVLIAQGDQAISRKVVLS
jgi:hypothetical protein